ncbi:MAG: UpxY family transcription antiterminator [Prevotella sp.]|nr:UpxY family transcription antiterminator [Prevotella sp.]
MSSWYVIRAIFKKETAVRDALRGMGLRCYVPMHYRIEMVRGHKVRCLVPAISDLVFVKGEVDEINTCRQKLRETTYWLTRPVAGQEQREKIMVPDKAMEDFIRVTERHEAEVTYFTPDEVVLSKGDRIRIHGGAFDGVEGVLLKVKGRRSKQLVVTIPDLAVAAVSITPEVIEVINEKADVSVDVVVGVKQLTKLASQLLSAAPDRDSQPHEYNLLHRDVERFYQGLLPLRGYIPSAEAELALALLLAERALGAVTDATLHRCREALSRLRDTSHLKARLLQELSHF